MKLVPFLLALALLGAVASNAGAAPRSTATADNLCTVGKGIASSFAHSSLSPTAGTSLAAMAKGLKTEFTRLKNAESIVLHNSPSSLKPHFVRAFAFYNLVYAKLSKANWNLAALVQSAPSLNAGEKKIAPDLRAINAYFNKCKK